MRTLKMRQYTSVSNVVYCLWLLLIVLTDAGFFHRYQYLGLQHPIKALSCQSNTNELQNKTIATDNGMPPALRELKERAEFTAKMEAVNSVADSIVQWTTKMAGKKQTSSVSKSIPKSVSKLSRKRPALSSALRRKITLRSSKRHNVISHFMKSSSPTAALPQRLAKKAPSSKVVQQLKTGRKIAGTSLITNTPSVARVRSVETIKAGGKIQGKAIAAAKSQVAGKPGRQVTKLFLKTTRKGVPVRSMNQLKAGGIASTKMKVVKKQGGKFTKQLLKKTRTARRSAVAARKGYIPKTSAVQKLAVRKTGIRAARRVAWRRVGRFLSLAMPILGGVFAVLAFRADLERAQDEFYDMLALLMFACAALCDYIDVLCHCLMTNALLLRGSSATFLSRVESISMACAILSTVSVILGEWRSPKREEEEQV